MDHTHYVYSLRSLLVSPTLLACSLEEERRPMVPRDLSNREERLAGASLLLRLVQNASIEDELNGFAKIAAEKGICLCGVRFTREAGARIRIYWGTKLKMTAWRVNTGPDKHLLGATSLPVDSDSIQLPYREIFGRTLRQFALLYRNSTLLITRSLPRRSMARVWPPAAMRSRSSTSSLVPFS
jgi:hypothetical protein